MNVDEALEDGNWALVTAVSGKQYIGKITLHPLGIPSDTKEMIAAVLNYPVRMTCVQEVSTMVIPQQVMTPDGPAMAMARNIQVVPIGLGLDVEETAMYMVLSEVLLFSEMTSRDKERHKKMVRDGVRSAIEQRAAASNIVLPGNRRA